MHSADMMCASGYPSVNPHVNSGLAVLTELLYTFALASVVLNVATTKAQENNSFFGLAIGFTITAAAIAAGPISGGAFNPAVGTALPAVHGVANDIWVYWLGPMAGGALAGAVFRLTARPEEFENKD